MITNLFWKMKNYINVVDQQCHRLYNTKHVLHSYKIVKLIIIFNTFAVGLLSCLYSINKIEVV